MGVGALLLILAILGRKLWLNGQYHGLTKGMVIGYRHGDRDGFNRGYSQEALDHVLAQPTEARHYAGIVSAIPDAEDSAAFWDAVRLDGVRRSVQGQEGLS
jgi:hypothetical protein